ncbi:putative DNA polymerase lambda [Amylocarpus encephaloides]|uniref:DNA polymerase n=1 Tax=Amylocarpus encephaloides TaxID=45428 RepID=A0A9P7YS35_9HELO|nr:putative DNA polymerase lambda [Amylocarpus encephaloides]
MRQTSYLASKTAYFDELYSLSKTSEEAEGITILKRQQVFTKASSKQTQKRKRGSEIKLVDEKDRIFRNQTFFYIPNDDVAKIRRLQIAKAQNYGAAWTKIFSGEVTHVIIDKDLTYQAVLTYMRSAFGIDAFPDKMVVVNVDYPMECIAFRALLNPEQTQYMVIGRRIRQLSGNSSFGAPEEIYESSQQKEPHREDADGRQTLPREDNLGEDQEQEHVSAKSSKESAGHPEVEREPSPRWEGFGDNEEFDEIIQFARETRLMPEDEGSNSRPSTAGSNEDNDYSDRERSPDRAVCRTKKRRLGLKGSFNQGAFSCMKGGKGTDGGENPNDEIIKDFMKMAAYYERTKDQWRNMSYRKGITALRRQTTKITTYEQAIQLPSIGDSLASKIEERHLNGRLAKLDYTNMDPRDIILQKFTKVYGVGSSQADKWINQGHKTLEDLTANVRLTTNQKIGIAHYDDFNTRISRSEMDQLAEIVKKAVNHLDPEVEVTIGGSFRRGALTSGDIDFMLTKANTTSASELLPFLHALVTHLTDTSFLVAALAVPRLGSDSGSKWHGACVLPASAVWRRIDLLLVPASEWGAALIYFTGDDIFNRSLRLLASKKGMRLNQRGLYEDCMRGPGRAKMTEGRFIEGLSERGIFARLGVPWRAPEERILN